MSSASIKPTTPTKALKTLDLVNVSEKAAKVLGEKPGIANIGPADKAPKLTGISAFIAKIVSFFQRFKTNDVQTVPTPTTTAQREDAREARRESVVETSDENFIDFDYEAEEARQLAVMEEIFNEEAAEQEFVNEVLRKFD